MCTSYAFYPFNHHNTVQIKVHTFLLIKYLKIRFQSMWKIKKSHYSSPIFTLIKANKVHKVVSNNALRRSSYRDWIYKHTLIRVLKALLPRWMLLSTHMHTLTYSPWCWRLAAAAAAAGADRRPRSPPGSHCVQGWRDTPAAPPGTTEGSSSLSKARQEATNRGPIV